MGKPKKEIRILYVEDDEAIYPYWIEWFRANYSERSDHVRSKDEAKRLVLGRRERYDIALVDLGILEFADSQDSQPAHGIKLIELIGDRVPCVMCSGEIGSETSRRSKAVGFLHKPCQEIEMAEVIDRILSSRQFLGKGRP